MTQSDGALVRELRQALPGLRLLEDEPMDRHCSFHLGGPAPFFAEPASEEELAALLRFFHKKGLRPILLGSGTNVLVPDEGLTAPVIHLGEGLASLSADGASLSAGAGLPLARLAAAARDRGLTGLEFAHGIPGSLGGGVLMNAGAYGGELSGVVRSVRCLSPEGEPWETAEPDFSYRHSRFMEENAVIVSARLELRPGNLTEIGEKMKALAERRAASQPLNLPSAGSAFKRPQGGYAAAMIDGAGLKGLRVGGAMVSEKHAGFIVNAGGATCADVLALMDRVRREVERVYGVILEPEVRLLGASFRWR